MGMEFVKPTIFLGVPRVWEKIAEGMKAVGTKLKFPMNKISPWAKTKLLEHSRNCQMGGNGQYPTKHALADFLIGLARKKIGLHELQLAITGAAPIQRETLEYWASIGINIVELFGMSESSALATVNSARYGTRWGSIGYALPGVEVAVFNTETPGVNKAIPAAGDLFAPKENECGELCFRGRNVMMGYLACPDLGDAHVQEIKKKTAETIDDEGWLHSGDKGMVTDKGMVKITGRYKELIIGEGGENIAPVPIEDHVKKMCDGINEIMMVGDKRKYNVAIITLKAKGANGETPGTDDLDAGATRVNEAVKTISGAMDDEVWIKAITEAITSANNNGKVCPNNAFKIQKFTILPTNFSEENNELTPTKKLKRKVVETSYKDVIDKMYASKDTYVHFSK